MSKKTKKKKAAPFSLKSYLKSGSARKLPIYECWIDDNWRESMKFVVIVARSHVNGNVTAGSYLVDLLCAGITQSHLEFNITKFHYQEYLDYVKDEMDINPVSCDYDLVHNIIYAACEFAEECGIPPCEDFKMSKYILEEDTDAIPLMDDIPLGEDGIPALYIDFNNPKAAYYAKQLKENCGEGNYKTIYFNEMEDFSEDEDEWDTSGFPTDEFDDELEEEEYDNDEFEFYDWDKEDWRTFIKDEMELDDIGELVNIYHLIYESVIFEKRRKTQGILNYNELIPEEFEITDKPLANNLTEEEEEILRNIYMSLDDPNKSKSELKKIKKEIENNIKKFPKIEAFYNYLYICAIKLNAYKESEKIIKEVRATFPDYLFGKFNEAQILIAKKKYDKVLSLFNHSFKVEDVFQNRKEIHFTEIKNYFTLLFLFYIQQNKLDDAYPYYKFLIANGYIEVNDDELGDIHQLFIRLEFKIMEDAKEYLDSIMGDETQVIEVAAILLESTQKMKEIQ